MVTEARVGHVTFWRLLTGLESKWVIVGLGLGMV